MFCFAGCGSGGPSGAGHGANLSVAVSDSVTQTVSAVTGAITTTPDGLATLEVPANALKLNTIFTIQAYISSQAPSVAAGKLFVFYPPDLSAVLNSGSSLKITLRYDPAALPSNISASDLRLGLYDTGNLCWKTVFLDSPVVSIAGAALSPVSSQSITGLGVFGIVLFNANTCT